MAKSFIGPQAVACTSQSAGGKSNSGHSAALNALPKSQTAASAAANGAVPGMWLRSARSGRTAVEMI
jgi:hypothetical protein